MDKNKEEYPINVKSTPDGDTEGLCPNCEKQKVYCSWGYKDKICPECGQKITWYRW